jgi:hypothetical protein
MVELDDMSKDERIVELEGEVLSLSQEVMTLRARLAAFEAGELYDPEDDTAKHALPAPEPPAAPTALSASIAAEVKAVSQPDLSLEEQEAQFQKQIINQYNAGEEFSEGLPNKGNLLWFHMSPNGRIYCTPHPEERAKNRYPGGTIATFFKVSEEIKLKDQTLRSLALISTYDHWSYEKSLKHAQSLAARDGGISHWEYIKGEIS